MEFSSKTKFIKDIISQCIPRLLDQPECCGIDYPTIPIIAICYENNCDTGINSCIHRFCHNCLYSCVQMVFLIYLI